MCLKGNRIDAVIDYRSSVVLDRTTYDIHVPALAIRVCDSCGEQFFGDAANETIERAICSAAGLLHAGDIADGRRVLGIRRKTELARLIGVAPETIGRWEAGHIVQSRLADRMLRLFFAVPQARWFLEFLSEGNVLPMVVKDDEAALLDWHRKATYRGTEKAGAALGFAQTTPQNAPVPRTSPKPDAAEPQYALAA